MYLGQTANLLADPPNTIRHALQRLDDSRQEAVRNLHEDVQTRSDDALYVRVRSSCFGTDATRKLLRQGAGFLLDLGDHLLVDLTKY
jgi:hypothetical protein